MKMLSDDDDDGERVTFLGLRVANKVSTLISFTDNY